MTIKRRDFLTFLGGMGGAMLFDVVSSDRPISKFSMPFTGTEANNSAFAAISSKLSFKPIKSVFEKLSEAFKENLNHANTEKSLRSFR